MVDANLNTVDVTTYVNVKNINDTGIVRKLADGTSQLAFSNAQFRLNGYKIYVRSDNLGNWNSDNQSYQCKN